MQCQAGPPENAREERGERVDHRAEPGKDQHLLLTGGDHLGDLAQALPFAAILFPPRIIGEPLRGMVADLLQPHQRGQHQSLAGNPIGIVERGAEIVDSMRVERRLLAA